MMEQPKNLKENKKKTEEKPKKIIKNLNQFVPFYEDSCCSHNNKHKKQQRENVSFVAFTQAYNLKGEFKFNKTYLT